MTYLHESKLMYQEFTQYIKYIIQQKLTEYVYYYAEEIFFKVNYPSYIIIYKIKK